MSILRTQVEIRLFNHIKGLPAFMIRFSIITCCVVLLFACKKKETVPAGILSKEQMVRVLSDIYIAEEKTNRLLLLRDSAEKFYEKIEDRVYEKNGVTDSVFKTSYDYYMAHPAEMELIYTALVDSLQLQEQKAPFRPNQ